MVAQKMGSHGGGSNNTGLSQAQPQSQIQSHDPNQLARQGSLYSLTLDEVQNQLGDLGKPLSSMNLDELLKTLWTAEANNQTGEGVDGVTNVQLPGQSAPGLSLNQQSNLMLSMDLSKKTVDEVWQDIQQGQKRSSLDRKTTLGEMTLEDFLVKAGVVSESAGGNKVLGSVADGGADPTGMPHHAQWMNYQMSSIHPQQQQQGMLPAFMPSHPVQQPITLGGNSIMDAAYPEMTMCSSPLMGTLSDTQTPGRKRVAPDDIAEKSVERRQKRMIKNRESAARSRARKQAYTHELENKVSRLEEENERLKRLQEVEKALPSIPPPEPKYQLRRTSSAPV
ncbi:ABSCISIC ACID-INSENSITIVE 5-like protein 2 [Salvia miltiorrhiza]|uniref:ABSCISIC ACID-INSENSITIVE 5-like protein 2 n=1 Tax=Salvia miltiorrhiza TaxID=226208 RepID=UPI0025AC21DC|nr:ABSCISIC ACID-INSENSITIVE 5-like protein 2 [Salvia miltiorrhiza]XP_057785280.1 ABSCISIC ACID-INSENSITIVE 5-like protein 2 [Salvia miltiorrhiza]XP_057785281.1 ABSCISIC ACID-INSENSITIVE 5-like protein 2 [Salvia miltiorrhiza]XP_057785282.1 ABSCISIC ACID-INSENSITIVE 5-like protein 2 [Salvia miltiorrhiza]XP_057785283.1 ABSCISIC ACID-INSENSITIVE 5-like protein 2 [Salvia miltiorrhiza]